MEEKTDSDSKEQILTKHPVAIIVGAIILLIALYVVFTLTKKANNGLDSMIGSDSGNSQKAEPSPIPRFTASSDVPWKDYTGRIFSYTFSYPETLPLLIFPGDKSDSVAFSWAGIPPQQNIVLNIEFIEDRDKTYLNKSKKDFVREWHQYFSGLHGVNRVEPFTNTNGLSGYKAYYVNYTGKAPNVDVFFEVPTDPDIMLHMANGIIDPDIFNRMVDSLEWQTDTTAEDNTPPSPAPER